jgi:hypothetical protein
MSSDDSHKSYRPLYTFILRYLYSFYGMSTSAYHIANIIAHMCCTALVFVLTFRFTKSDVETSFVCGMLFAVHPIHTESVANIAHGAGKRCFQPPTVRSTCALPTISCTA